MGTTRYIYIYMCVTYFLGFLRALLTWIMAVLVLFVLLRVSHVAVAIRILSQWRRTWRGGGEGYVKRGWRTRHETRGVLIVARSSCCVCVLLLLLLCCLPALAKNLLRLPETERGAQQTKWTTRWRAAKIVAFAACLLFCFCHLLIILVYFDCFSCCWYQK